MPFVIYIFAVFAFALGLAEFGMIGLVDVMAKSLNAPPESVGRLVSAYALGATFSAPILTALFGNFSRKKTLMITMTVFSVGSFFAAFGGHLTLMMLARFVAGLGHGLFLAVATSTATRLVAPEKAGQAVALVFTGFTVAMAIGVPVSTYLGEMVAWQWILFVVSVFGVIGLLGLIWAMKNPIKNDHKINTLDNIKLLANAQLLKSASVTLLAYAGAFATYTYIAPFVVQIAGENSEKVGLYMLIFGIFAFFGNIAGGKLTDKWGVKTANIALVGLLTISSVLFFVMGASAFWLKIVVAIHGFATFGVVPSLQAFLIGQAQKQGEQAVSIAAGLNIAGFNCGIALGSSVGGVVLAGVGVAYVGVAGAVMTALGLVVFWLVTKEHTDTMAVQMS